MIDENWLNAKVSFILQIVASDKCNLMVHHTTQNILLHSKKRSSFIDFDSFIWIEWASISALKMTKTINFFIFGSK